VRHLLHVFNRWVTVYDELASLLHVHMQLHAATWLPE
jgi:hypothetical protein